MRAPLHGSDVALTIAAAVIEITLIGRWLHRHVWGGIPT